jgi:hypothetical protein
MQTVFDRRRDKSIVWSSLFPIRTSRFINIVDKWGIDPNNVLLDKGKILVEENAGDLEERVFLRVNLGIPDSVLMPEQKAVQPSVCKRLSVGIFDFVETFAFLKALETSCTSQNHFDDMFVLILIQFVKPAPRLPVSHFAFTSHAAEPPNVFF